MDPLAHAASLARAMIGLARSKASGVLHVTTGHARAQLVMSEGRITAAAVAPDDDRALGDMLAQSGNLDWQAHARALHATLPRGPVGAWLVEMGVASRPAVSQALRQQLEARVLACFAWQPLDYRFEAGGTRLAASRIDTLLDAIELALCGMRHVIDAVPRTRLERLLAGRCYTRTALGEALLCGGGLMPQENLLLLRADERPLTQEAAARQHPEGALAELRALALLELVGAIRADVQAQSYALLLRKARQLRARATPEALLDLPRSASPELARRALRRFASQLHPDRFGPQVPVAVRQASTEIMSALAGAERALRQQGAGA